MSRGSSGLEHALDQLRDRAAQVDREHAEGERDLEAAREALARSVAHSAPEAELTSARDRARSLAEHVEGLARARPLLADEISALEEEYGRVRAQEAAAEAASLVARAIEKVRALAAAVDSSLDEILALADETSAATNAAWRAEVHAAELARSPVPSASRANSAWPQLMAEFLSRARLYRDSRLREAPRARA